MAEPNKEYFVDVFQDIIDHIILEYDPIITSGNPPVTTGGIFPYAMYGSRDAVVRELIEKNDNKQNKYPLIVLIQDLDEDHGKTLSNQYISNPRIIILEESKKDFYPEDRMTNSFKSVLQPLYNLLLEEIADNPNINVGLKCQIDHKKTNRLDWGTQIANDKLNEFLDGIDIKFNNFKVFVEIPEPILTK